MDRSRRLKENEQCQVNRRLLMAGQRSLPAPRVREAEFTVAAHGLSEGRIAAGAEVACEKQHGTCRGREVVLCTATLTQPASRGQGCCAGGEPRCCYRCYHQTMCLCDPLPPHTHTPPPPLPPLSFHLSLPSPAETLDICIFQQLMDMCSIIFSKVNFQ